MNKLIKFFFGSLVRALISIYVIMRLLEHLASISRGNPHVMYWDGAVMMWMAFLAVAAALCIKWFFHVMRRAEPIASWFPIKEPEKQKGGGKKKGK